MPDSRPGDEVCVNGFGLGETHFGGYAERARVKGDWLVRAARRVDPRRGDGGRHGGLLRRRSCVLAIEAAGVTPAMGSALVTGAAGGVGSVAIALFWRRPGGRSRPRPGASPRPVISRRSARVK